MNVKLGIPSKGRMRQEVSAWFSQRGTKILTAGHDRSYSAHLVDFPEMQIIFLPATEIPNELACGRIHLGITGQDLVAVIAEANSAANSKPDDEEGNNTTIILAASISGLVVVFTV